MFMAKDDLLRINKFTYENKTIPKLLAQNKPRIIYAKTKIIFVGFGFQ